MNLIFLCLSKCKFYWVASKVYTLHAAHCSLHFHKLQKIEIHSLNKFICVLVTLNSNKTF